MLLLPHTRVERQIVFNRSFEIIVEYEDAGRIVPFFEVLILMGMAGNFSYRLILDSDNKISPSEWKKIGNCLREALSAFEEKRFETNGRLFGDDSAWLEKTIIRQEKL
jgi:hypothetical protein